MGNVQSQQEFEAAQAAAKEQGRQEMRKKLEELEKVQQARQQQALQAAFKEGQADAMEEGEVSDDSRRDSAAGGRGVSVKNEKKEEEPGEVIPVKSEPKVKEAANSERANERAAEKASLLDREAAAANELAAARRNSSRPDPADPLNSWSARKQPRQKAATEVAGRVTSSATLIDRRRSTDVRSPKRTVSESGFADERRASKKPSISTSSPATPKSPDQASEDRQPPEWYRQMKFEGSRGKQESEAEPLLNGLKIQIKKAQDITKKAQEQGRKESQLRIDLQPIFNEVRDKLHKVVFIKVSKKGLRNTRALDNENGLPQIFDNQYGHGVSWPFDIKADAEELYNKWSREDFETDLMRGINCGKPKSGKDKSDRSSDSLLDGYPKIDGTYYGNGKLLNGQWWPTQLTCLRDGAHASSQGGISGGRIDLKEGAYSCIMSGGHEYGDDEDHGDWAWYCGTDCKDGSGKITESTLRMIHSVGKNPVRLIRSHNLGSKWAPKKGFRYDGLYDVVEKERLDKEGHPRARYRFKLVRREGQDPIRGGDGPERRPTDQELAAYEKDKHLRGF